MATSKSSKSSNEYGSGIANADVLNNKRAEAKRAEAKRDPKRSPAVSIYLDKESHLELKIAAARLERSMADICREQVEKWLVAYKNGEIAD